MGIIRAELGERVDDITLTALRMARVGSKWLPVSFFIHSYMAPEHRTANIVVKLIENEGHCECRQAAYSCPSFHFNVDLSMVSPRTAILIDAHHHPGFIRA